MGAIAVLGLSRPTCNVRPGSCWCEAPSVDPSVKYCKLCVNYFKNRHAPRTQAMEKRRANQSQKRKSVPFALEMNPGAKRVQNASVEGGCMEVVVEELE
jgi:hypothetical protein